MAGQNRLVRRERRGLWGRGGLLLSDLCRAEGTGGFLWRDGRGGGGKGRALARKRCGARELEEAAQNKGGLGLGGFRPRDELSSRQ